MDIKGLMKEVKKQADSFLDEYTMEVTGLIQMAYDQSIEEFYNDNAFLYSNPTNVPKYYHRKDNLFLASSHYNRAYRLNKTNRHLAGIMVDADRYIPEDAYKDDKTWIFERAYHEGIHGITSSDDLSGTRIQNIPLKMNPTPEQIMLKKFNKISSDKFLGELQKKMLSGKGSYKYIKKKFPML